MGSGRLPTPTFPLVCQPGTEPGAGVRPGRGTHCCFEHAGRNFDAAMVYDHLPIIDIFRLVDEDPARGDGYARRRDHDRPGPCSCRASSRSNGRGVPRWLRRSRSIQARRRYCRSIRPRRCRPVVLGNRCASWRPPPARGSGGAGEPGSPGFRGIRRPDRRGCG
ncbi:DUF4334 domain-containing protein [Nocardia sp. NEAU-G5]|uniref:DUF4334 domain-containing protein n=1 Tax=Nocardia albiluteola TaxID=2842303 RepID=A0ABS6B706_9NOCA|nr:DUF4334 domain-containing protein [Nocardia albiluteola]